MFLWPVTIVVKFCVMYIFVRSLSATFGKRHKKGPRGHQRGHLAEKMGHNK
jgi:hypothetical protein